MSLVQKSRPDLMDALVVAVAEQADRDAFARLFAYFAPRVKGFLMRRGASAGLAEEIAQETMLAVWRKAAQFSPGRGTASTWVFTIARNLAVDRLRRDGPVLDVEDPGLAPEEAVESAEAGLISAEREQRLRAALITLPPEQSTILQLSFFQDRPHSEVADALGIPLGTVKSRIRLAVARLRLLLDDLA